MIDQSERKRPLAMRVAALLFPPAGLLILWRTSATFGKKLLGTVAILLYCLPYTGLILFLLVRFAGLQVEWRGGFPPVLTYSKTLPDFDALEKDRLLKAQQNQSALVARTNYPTPYWTDFRGPNRDGHYQESAIHTNWSLQKPDEVWHQPIGGGYASFVVAEGLAFTIEQRRNNEVASAYDLQTGREVWTNGWPAFFQESMGGDGPRATPTYDDGKVYMLGAEGELRCLEASSGKVVWSKNILTENGAPNLYYAMSAAPLVVDDKLIVQAGGVKNASVVAYNKKTGQPIWKSLNDPAAYSSPMLVNLAGQPQLLVVTETRAVGLEVNTGKLLWEYPWVVNLKNRNIAQPVILGNDRFFLSAGYNTGCAAVEISKSNSVFTAHTLWKNKFLKNKFSSSVFWKGHIYGLDEDILTCLDATTGERKWKDGRYGYGQILLASGHLVILAGTGDLALVEASPTTYKEIARFPALHGKTWNHPAIAHGKLLVRNAVEMACFDLLPR